LTVPSATGKNKEVNREQAIAPLRGYEPELRALGVVSASLFGSVARDDAGGNADVDVVVEPVRKERFRNEINRDRVLAF
jgi:predicted nucleotidyltransferase